MKPKARTNLLMVVAVLILAGIVWYAASRNTVQPSATPTQATQTPGSVTFAPTGQLVPGFPKGLILDSNAAVNGSYSINYSSTTKQYTASWTSSSSMLSLYGEYKQYLPAHGWPIVNTVTNLTNTRGIYADNGSSTVGVAIFSQGSGSQISVTYLTK